MSNSVDEELARAIEDEQRLYDEIAAFRRETSIGGVLQWSSENAKRLADLHKRQDAISIQINKLLGRQNA